MKKAFAFILTIIFLLFIAGCSSGAAPPAATPTPIPVVVQAQPTQPTTPAIGPSNADSPIQDEGSEKATVDSLVLKTESLFPVKARLTIGGSLPADCLEISGWQ